ncbi:MAG: DUF4340 domain-containing protein [Clostridia bacterium]|nr:DUF4340 domain-containing protein [Clostridia bacterium]
MQHPHKMKRKTGGRRMLPPWAYLAAAFGLALAFALALPENRLLFPGRNAAKPVKPSTFQALKTIDKSGLESITVTQRDKESYTLLYRDERLFLKREGGTPALINEAYDQEIVSAATVFAVEDTIARNADEVRPYLKDMGLEPPEITVRVTSAEGWEDVLQLGWPVPESSCYYYRWSGDPGVYMCDSGIYEAFEMTPQMLLPVEQPLLQASLTDRCAIAVRGREPLEILFFMDQGGHVSGTLQKPFAYPLGEEQAAALLSAVANFRLGPMQEELPGAKDAYAGGPLATIHIHQRAGAYADVDENGVLTAREAQEQTLALTLWEKTDGYFYACEYEGRLYHVNGFLLAAFLQATSEGLVTKNPADMGENGAIASIHIQVEGRVLDFRRVRMERVLPNNELALDEDGNILYDVQTLCNGEPFSHEAFDLMVVNLAAMEVLGSVEEEDIIGSRTPRWQMTITTEGGAARMLAAYPINAFYDAIAVDGTVRHELQAESLQIALGDLL